MSTQSNTRTIGPVTTAATAGAGVAGAVTVILVWGLSQAGVDVPDTVSSAITLLLGALGALAGGYLAPSQAEAVAAAVAEHGVDAETVAQQVTDQVLEAGQTGLDSTQVAVIAGHAAEQVVRAQAERAAVIDPTPRPAEEDATGEEAEEGYAPAHASAAEADSDPVGDQLSQVETLDPSEAAPTGA